MSVNRELVLILDFGSQYTQLIARRIREQQGLLRDPPVQPAARRRSARMRPTRASCSRAARRACTTRARRRCRSDAVRARRAGARHLLRHAAHGAAARRQGRARRQARVRPRAGQRQRRGARTAVRTASPAGEELEVWMSHGDRVESLPHGFTLDRRDAERAATPRSPTRSGKIYGIQFHPEVVHTPRGGEILLRTSCSTCAGSRRRGRMANFAEEARSTIRAKVGERGASSAGSRAASTRRSRPMLCSTRIGDRLTCIFVDNGLLRQGEARRSSSAVRERVQARSARRRRRASASCERSRASPIPSRSARSSAASSSTVFEEEAQAHRRASSSSSRARSIPT